MLGSIYHMTLKLLKVAFVHEKCKDFAIYMQRY